MLSIVIPAFNCADDLPALLDSIRKTALTDYEVIIVDDASTAGSLEPFADGARVTVERLEENRGPSHARNLGASLARGDELVFVDSDVLLPSDRDVLADMVAVLDEQPDVDCVSTISDVHPREPGAIAYNHSVYHSYYMERFLGGQESRKGTIMFFTTRLGAIRKERFRAAGGFQERLTGVMNEDGDFGSRCYSMGYVSYMSARLVNLHRYPTTFPRFVRNYYLTAYVQALIDRQMDTSADESASIPEMLRRIYALSAYALPILPFAVGVGSALGIVAAWFMVFLLSFGSMSRMIWRDVPARTRLPWFLVYIAITPTIFAGYLHGVLLHASGRTLLGGQASDMDFFS